MQKIILTVSDRDWEITMRFKLDTNYSGEKMRFLEEHSCKILSEIKLSKTKFSEYEIPRRMFVYGGVYIAEIMDDETGSLVWAVLSKWKGIYHFSTYYASLEALERGM